MTFPAPRHIIVAPGELGHSSVREDADTKLYFWEMDPASTTIQYAKVWAQLKSLTQQILSGKLGDVQTFGLDGLHKLYYAMQKAMGFTADTDAKEYVKYHEAFGNFISPILGSATPYVAMTCYDGQEATEPGSKVTQVFPDLPGKQAKAIMGAFPVVFHAERLGDGEKEKYIWRLRSTGKIQACGMHLPPDIRGAFPAELPQDWREVEKILGSFTTAPAPTTQKDKE